MRFLVTESIGGPQEKRLLGSLLSDYNSLNRPVLNESEALMLTFGVTLQQIIDVVSTRTSTGVK
jgi:nicotinic acetylcholine receptor